MGILVLSLILLFQSSSLLFASDAFEERVEKVSTHLPHSSTARTVPLVIFEVMKMEISVCVCEDATPKEAATAIAHVVGKLYHKDWSREMNGVPIYLDAPPLFPHKDAPPHLVAQFAEIKTCVNQILFSEGRINPLPPLPDSPSLRLVDTGGGIDHGKLVKGFEASPAQAFRTSPANAPQDVTYLADQTETGPQSPGGKDCDLNASSFSSFPLVPLRCAFEELKNEKIPSSAEENDQQDVTFLADQGGNGPQSPGGENYDTLYNIPFIHSPVFLRGSSEQMTGVRDQMSEVRGQWGEDKHLRAEDSHSLLESSPLPLESSPRMRGSSCQMPEVKHGPDKDEVFLYLSSIKPRVTRAHKSLNTPEIGAEIPTILKFSFRPLIKIPAPSLEFISVMFLLTLLAHLSLESFPLSSLELRRNTTSINLSTRKSIMMSVMQLHEKSALKNGTDPGSASDRRYESSVERSF